MIFRILFPRYCAICKNTITASELICKDCFKELPRIQNTAYCKKTINCHAGFLYRGHIKTLITGLKFHHQLMYVRLLAHLMIKPMQAHYQNQFPQLILPIPLHKKRLQERGFNQSVEIAKVLRKIVKKDYGHHIEIDTRSLIRKKATEPQAQLTAAERKTNIKNAFQLIRKIESDHIMLLDDVITTGGTMSECISALKKSEIKRIDVWSIARAD